MEEQARVRAHVAANPRLFLLHSPAERIWSGSDRQDDQYPANADSFTQLIQLNDPHRFAARLPVQRFPRNRQCSFFLFQFEARPGFSPGFTAARDGLESQSGCGRIGDGPGDFGSGGAGISDCAPGDGRPKSATSSQSACFTSSPSGLGYILVEIAFIQRFVLFLGHPVYALTVVVFLLLLSSGAGSMVSRWWLAETRRLGLTLVLIAGALLVYVALLPGLLNRLVGLPFAAKLLVSAALLIPLGLAMGMPFPDRAPSTGSYACKRISRCTRERNRWKSGGVGLGHERGLERSRFGSGHYHRHPVRTECHPGFRRCSLSPGVTR